MANDVRIRATVNDQVSGPLAKIRDKFDTLGKSGGFKALAQGVGMGAGIAAWNMVGNATRAAVDVMQDSIAAASDQREAMALNEQVFKESADKIDDWSDTTAKAFGQSKTEAINFAATFGNTLKAAGVSADELADKSMELTKRAADIGSAFNVAGDDVATALRAGLVGEVEPLRRFGILLNAAKVESKALEMGLAGTKKELTEGHKVLARYQLILEESSESAGMFGRDVDSLADKQKILTARWEDAQVNIGNVLLPKVTELAEAFLFVGDALEEVAAKSGPAEDAVLDFADAAASMFRPDKVLEFSETFQDTVDDIVRSWTNGGEEMVDLTDDLKRDFRVFGTSFQTVAGTIEEETDRITVSYEEMVDALTDDTSRLIDDVYDPAILHAELAATKEEYAAQKRIATSKNSTDEQIRDAKRRMLTLTKNADETRLQLLEAGELTAEETKEWLTKLERKYDKSTGRAKADVGALIAKIRELSAVTSPGIDIVIRGLRNATGRGQQRAVGGPIDPDKVYMVGENGPEMFVSKDAGTIIPNHKLGGGKGGGVGPLGLDSATITVSVVSAGVLSPAHGQAIAREIGPHLRDYLNRRG